MIMDTNPWGDIPEVPKAITAADLRNAALVMDHLGHEVGGFVNLADASVCLDGAIRLATEASLEYRSSDSGAFWALSDAVCNSPRRVAATDALAKILPDRCTFKHDSSDSCGFTAGDGLLHGDSRVYHYSDFICDGKDEGSALLVQAAEKLEAEL